MAPAPGAPTDKATDDRAGHFALVSADYDFGSPDLDLLGTVTVRVLENSVLAQEEGYSPEEDAVASLEEVDLQTGLHFARARADQVELELEGLGTYFVGRRPSDGAVEWPPTPPVLLRPFAPRAPWKRPDAGGPVASWLLTVQVTTATWPDKDDADPAGGPLHSWAGEHGWSVDSTTLDAFLAELGAAPAGPDGSRMLYTPHSPTVSLERETEQMTYQQALDGSQGLRLPEGCMVGRVAVEPHGSGDRGWEPSLRLGDPVILDSSAVDLSSGAPIAAGSAGTVAGMSTGGGQRPRYRVHFANGQRTTATQSQLLAAS